MRRAVLNLVLSVGCPLSTHAGECLVVDRGRIHVADLAGSVPQLAALPSDLVFGYAPAPGQTRLIRGSEITAFLARQKVAVIPGSQQETVCVKRRSERLDPRQVAEAVTQAFQPREVRVTVVEISDMSFPAGSLQFDLAQLPVAAPSAESVIWRGVHRDGEGRTRPFWARVQLSAKGCRLVAAKNLTPNQPLSKNDIRIEAHDEFPRSSESESCEIAFEQMTLRTPTMAGAVIQRRDLVTPTAVEQGAPITVRVESGKAELSITGRAEASGRVGERVAFTTGLSKRRQIGTVIAKGTVKVVSNNE